MPSTILFSNASFDEPAQATVLRSIESVKRKALEDNTLELYKNRCSNSVEKKEALIGCKSILESVDNYIEHKTINTILESQSTKIDFTSDFNSPTVKKRKLKIIPNKIDVATTPITVDAKNKTVDLMTKVSVYFGLIVFHYFNT